MTLFRPVKLHGNARLTPVQRRLLCERIDEDRWTVADAADAIGAVATIERLRRLRMTSTEIAARLDPPEPPNRYCRRHPGELIHIDIKRLSRFDRPGHRMTGRDQGGKRAPVPTVCWVAIHPIKSATDHEQGGWATRAGVRP